MGQDVSSCDKMQFFCCYELILIEYYARTLFGIPFQNDFGTHRKWQCCNVTEKLWNVRAWKNHLKKTTKLWSTYR